MLSLAVFLLVLAASSVAQDEFKHPHYAPGHDTMVHLFEWKWNDIARECEEFLGPMGYGGVQVSPIQENVIVPKRPWWERYQPISFEWYTRSGTKDEFIDMVRRCNSAGVRIYVDIVVNHMTGDHRDAVGTGGSVANTYARSYPAVPYNISHFHSECAINDYNNPANVRNCELVGLHDLDQSNEHVRNKIVSFMNAAIDAGVAGFRIDAAKHMWPDDLNAIYNRLNNLNTLHGFPANVKPYIFQEVIDWGNEAISKSEYNKHAAVTEFRHGAEISRAFTGNNPLKWLDSWGVRWGFLPSKDALVFVDNHDTQRGGSAIYYKQSKNYKMAVAFMLAFPYGNPRVMSSFHFNHFDDGPPADVNGNLLSPEIHPDNTCSYGWVCEHRWRQIYNMVRFRNYVNGTKMVGFWNNGNNQIAFSRETRGFVAFNLEQHDMKIYIWTALPPGRYCDVISGNLEDNKCTGKVVAVQKNGAAFVEILSNEEDGVLAIHGGAKLRD